MARRYDFYGPIDPEEIQWISVAFPEGDDNQIPGSTGIYRFIIYFHDDNQTLFVDVAPSDYGESLQDCFVAHRTECSNELSDFRPLYKTNNIEFEHHTCSKRKAHEHKRCIVSYYKPHYNMIELKVGKNSVKNPFQN